MVTNSYYQGFMLIGAMELLIPTKRPKKKIKGKNKLKFVRSNVEVLGLPMVSAGWNWKSNWVTHRDNKSNKNRINNNC